MRKNVCSRCPCYEWCTHDAGGSCVEALMGEDSDDAYAGAYINRRRREFVREWRSYVSDRTYGEE